MGDPSELPMKSGGDSDLEGDLPENIEEGKYRIHIVLGCDRMSPPTGFKHVQARPKVSKTRPIMYEAIVFNFTI